MKSRREDIVDDSEALRADNKLVQKAVKRHIIIPNHDMVEESDSEEDIHGTDEATRARQQRQALESVRTFRHDIFTSVDQIAAKDRALAA